MADPLDEVRKLYQAGKLDRAAQALRVVTALQPKNVMAHRFAVRVALDQGQVDRALDHSRKAFALTREDPQAAADHGGLLATLGYNHEAADAMAPLLEKHPDHPRLTANAASLWCTLGRFTQAEAMCRRGLERNPADAVLLGTLAMVLHSTGRTDQALPLMRQAAHADPAQFTPRSCLATYLNYLPDVPPADVLKAHREYGDWLTAPRLEPRPAWPPMSSGERLRIGFISPDLRAHSVAFFAEPILEHLDRWRFDVHVYQTGGEPDGITERLKNYPVTWRDLRKLLPGDRLKAFTADRCHILVEMSGLTLGNSLQLLSRRPAPVLVSYAGYPNTTGCRFIDARIVDTITDPPGSEAWHVERLIRMTPPFLCYRPPVDAPAVAHRDEGVAPTFGCFGFPGKYNARTLGLWARVLQGCPGSRLAIKSQTFKDPGVPELTRGILAQAGVDPSRVDVLEPTAGVAAHLAKYDSVDVALDTFPYHGTTTTCEAMLMGVPTVTLVGDTHVSRVGLSLLTQVGLADLCADSDDGFVRAAIALMKDAPRRRTLRESLRGTLLASPLCDGPAFARRFAQAIEDACRPFRPLA